MKECIVFIEWSIYFDCFSLNYVFVSLEKPLDNHAWTQKPCRPFCDTLDLKIKNRFADADLLLRLEVMFLLSSVIFIQY